MVGSTKAAFSGRSATRGLTEFPDSHGFEPEFLQFSGDGFRAGFLPCDEKTIYWFFTWTPTAESKGVDESSSRMKQFVLSKLGKAPEKVKYVVERSQLDTVISSPLRFRWPWNLLWANISKENVCVAGDALHPMTPDLGQRACSALEDGVVLARCLGEALLKKLKQEQEECGRIKKGLGEIWQGEEMERHGAHWYGLYGGLGTTEPWESDELCEG